MNQTLAALSLSFHGEVAVVFCLHHFFTQKSGRQKTMTAGDRFTRDEREQENEMWSDQTLDLPSLEVSGGVGRIFHFHFLLLSRGSFV